MGGLMEWLESGGDEDRRAEERGDGELLKHRGIQASQRKEINGVCLSVSMPLCAERPLIKHTSHIWHKRGAWGTNPSLSPCFIFTPEERSSSWCSDTLCVYWCWWRMSHILTNNYSVFIFACYYVVIFHYKDGRLLEVTLRSPHVYLSIKALSNQPTGNDVPCYLQVASNTITLLVTDRITLILNTN